MLLSFVLQIFSQFVLCLLILFMVFFPCRNFNYYIGNGLIFYIYSFQVLCHSFPFIYIDI